jgi:hypothetical protein
MPNYTTAAVENDVGFPTTRKWGSATVVVTAVSNGGRTEYIFKKL